MLGATPNPSDRRGLWRNPSPFRHFQRRGRLALAIAVAAALGAGCLERPIDSDAPEPPGSKPSLPSEAGIVSASEADLCELLGPELCKLAGSLTVRSAKDGRPVLLIVYQPERDEGAEPASVATTRPEWGETAEPASVATTPAGPGPPEIATRELRSRGRRVSGDALLALDQELRDAEEEFPLEFRFSYEGAMLVVFGKREHHEAFRRLRRAAEKAIETQTPDAMLEMLRRDGARNGPFWKLAHGHREWNAIREALEHRDRDRLWREHEHAEPERRESPQASSHENALDRLRAMRERIGMLESELRPAFADR